MTAYRAPRRRFLYRSASLLASALAVIMTACEDAASPLEEAHTTDELLILALSADAPAPGSSTFYVFNGRETIHLILHPDQFNNLYLRLRFPGGTLDSVAGNQLAPDDSLLVTIDPMPGGYGFTLSPETLVFSSATPTVATFSYARYGDLGVADGSSSYADRSAYGAALQIWRATGFDLWEREAGSGPAGPDAVDGRLASAGDFVLAAPR